MAPPTAHSAGQYEPLSMDDVQSIRENRITRKPGASILRPISALALFLITLLAGFGAGRQSIQTTQDGLLVPQGNIPEIWHHNLTFSEKPTPESEEAWSSIIPVGRGFVHHPELAPFISNIAVFHQLHCLHGIRVAYYTTVYQLDLATGSSSQDRFLEDIGARTDNVHMRHCFDYLRHAIMCAADTNLESVSQKERITTGWGSKRQCRDYDAVKEWAEQWRNSSDTGIL